MTTAFTEEHAARIGTSSRRTEAARRLSDGGLPDTSTEEWRYSPIADLELDSYRVVTSAPASGTATDDGSAALVSVRAAATIDVVDGFVVAIDLAPGWEDKGLSIATGEHFVDVPGERSLLEDLGDAFAAPALTIDVTPGLVVSDPVVVRHRTSAGVMAVPTTIVDVASGSALSIVETHESSDDALILPRTRLTVGSDAVLRHALVQSLDRHTWQLGRIVGSVADQGLLDSGLVGFGARYARLRIDTDLDGRGARGVLTGAYFGDDDQILDYRTFQDHRAPNTESDMLFKGAVDDAAGSIYTGTIRIHPDGAGSNAFQTNRNIKLGDRSWAWSVPNLEIENNDVRCSHASTVSPVDPDQRFYLHSRGVPPAAADRLIVAGFFEQALRRMPVDGVGDYARSVIGTTLDRREATS